MSIVMGLDQHRTPITAEWVDTTTRPVTRATAARRAADATEPIRQHMKRRAAASPIACNKPTRRPPRMRCR
jgi:hypothetical protein